MRHIRSVIYSSFSGLAFPKPGWQHICLRTVLWKSHLLKVKSRQMCKDLEWITKNSAECNTCCHSKWSYLDADFLPLWWEIRNGSPNFLLFFFFFFYYFTFYYFRLSPLLLFLVLWCLLLALFLMPFPLFGWPRSRARGAGRSAVRRCGTMGRFGQRISFPDFFPFFYF